MFALTDVCHQQIDSGIPILRPEVTVDPSPNVSWKCHNGRPVSPNTKLSGRRNWRSFCGTQKV